jgi:hypothetical protein
VMDMTGDTAAVRVISWELARWHYDPAVWVILWAHTRDAGAGSLWSRADLPDQAEYVERKLGPLVIMHVALLPFDTRFIMPDDDPDPFGLKQHSGQQVLDMLHLLWMFLGMDITATRQPLVARPARRRALRSLKHGEVNVVLLRRLAHPDDGRPVSHREVDWSCRWVVQGHYRHLDSYDQARHHAVAEHKGKETVCGACGSRLTYVRPYVKGPDGAPLRAAGPTLHKLAR